MENSLLSQSEIAATKAFKFQNQGRYDSAIEEHLRAAEILTKLRDQLSRGNSLINSLPYFINHHKRQAELDEVLLSLSKKERPIGKVKIMSIKSIEHSKTDFSSNIMPSSRSQKERFRVFEEPDSLLAQSCSSQTSKYIVRPKSDVEIIEEYKVMIHNLKAVVAKQAEELMEARKKSAKDDEIIRELTRRLEKYEPASSSVGIDITSSQYLPEAIPELPPLELPPDCDFGI